MLKQLWRGLSKMVSQNHFVLEPISYHSGFPDKLAHNFRYHVPRSWLKPTGNLLVVFEEWGGNPNGISLVRREIDSVCAYMYEWQPTLINWQLHASGKVNKPLRPKAHLMCGPGQKIKSIKFASFGTPEGVCGSYRQGSCHAFHSYDAFQRVCIFSV